MPNGTQSNSGRWTSSVGNGRMSAGVGQLRRAIQCGHRSVYDVTDPGGDERFELMKNRLRRSRASESLIRFVLGSWIRSKGFSSHCSNAPPSISPRCCTASKSAAVGRLKRRSRSVGRFDDGRNELFHGRNSGMSRKNDCRQKRSKGRDRFPLAHSEKRWR